MTDVDNQRAVLAEAFDRSIDPLADLASVFDELAVDPFNIFRGNVLEPRGLAASTLAGYDSCYKQWREHMTAEGRHPACPSEEHVLSFIRRRLEAGDSSDTVKLKLSMVNQAYEHWQADAVFPHPTDYNPITSAHAKASFPDSVDKDFPRLSLEELREKVAQVTHHRDRVVIVLQLKLGLRAGEVSNIKLEDISLSNQEIRSHYPDLGTHEQLGDRENVLYVPPSVNSGVPAEGRKGNKSQRPRLLPLDGELRRVLLRYLLVRPNVDEPWVFLTKQRYNQLDPTDPLRIWEAAFQPEYAETHSRRAIRSHFGRHWFTTYWQVHQDLSPELVVYMRGDKPGSSVEDAGAVRHYIHTYYEDIEHTYRQKTFKLNV